MEYTNYALDTNPEVRTPQGFKRWNDAGAAVHDMKSYDKINRPGCITIGDDFEEDVDKIVELIVENHISFKAINFHQIDVVKMARIHAYLSAAMIEGKIDKAPIMSLPMEMFIKQSQHANPAQLAFKFMERMLVERYEGFNPYLVDELEADTQLALDAIKTYPEYDHYKDVIEHGNKLDIADLQWECKMAFWVHFQDR